MDSKFLVLTRSSLIEISKSISGNEIVIISFFSGPDYIDLISKVTFEPHAFVGFSKTIENLAKEYIEKNSHSNQQ